MNRRTNRYSVRILSSFVSSRVFDALAFREVVVFGSILIRDYVELVIFCAFSFEMNKIKVQSQKVKQHRPARVPVSQHCWVTAWIRSLTGGSFFNVSKLF
jgi:hypothetical protein